MNEDVRLVVKLASECIDFEETILSKYAYSNVIRPPVNCHSFFPLLFFSPPSSSILLLVLPSLPSILRSISLSPLPPIPLLLFRMQIIRHSADGLPRKFTAVLIPRGAEVLSETKAQGRLESAKKRGFFSFFASVSGATVHVSKRSYLDPDRTTSCRNFGRPATRSTRSTTY